MSTRLEIHVSGLPFGQPRPRACVRAGGHASVYDPGTSNLWKACVIKAAKDAIGTTMNQPISSPVALCVTFRMPRPKSHYRTGKHAGALKLTAPLAHSVKPDLENLEKSTMDALTAAGVWVDDSLVCRKTTFKIYGMHPGAMIVVEEVAK